MVRVLGVAGVLGCVPLVWIALAYLAERDYVAAALGLFGATAIGHLGLELLALAQSPRGAGR